MFFRIIPYKILRKCEFLETTAGPKRSKWLPRKNGSEILDLRAYSKLREKTTSVPSSCTNFKGAMTIAWSCVDPGWLDNHLFLLYVKLEEPPFFIGIYHPKGSPHCFKKGGWLPGFFSTSNRLRKIPEGPCKIWAAKKRPVFREVFWRSPRAKFLLSSIALYKKYSFFYHFCGNINKPRETKNPDVGMSSFFGCQVANLFFFFFRAKLEVVSPTEGDVWWCFHRFSGSGFLGKPLTGSG